MSSLCEDSSRTDLSKMNIRWDSTGVQMISSARLLLIIPYTCKKFNENSSIVGIYMYNQDFIDSYQNINPKFSSSVSGGCTSGSVVKHSSSELAETCSALLVLLCLGAVCTHPCSLKKFWLTSTTCFIDKMRTFSLPHLLNINIWSKSDISPRQQISPDLLIALLFWSSALSSLWFPV